MGSRTRFNYTMTGDNVNLAARMESGAKQWGVYAMTTESTKIACEKHGGDRVVFRALGRIVVKGRTQAVPLYEVFGFKEHVTSTMSECLRLFDRGLAKYHERDWDAARALFVQSGELETHLPGRSPGVSNNPSMVYQELTAKLKQTPPPADWEGVFTMSDK
jgi:adenylate cyclase